MSDILSQKFPSILTLYRPLTAKGSMRHQPIQRLCMRGTSPTITVSQSAAVWDTAICFSKEASIIRMFAVSLRYAEYLVWLIPAGENAAESPESILPAGEIPTLIRGPFSVNNEIPLAVPSDTPTEAFESSRSRIWAQSVICAASRLIFTASIKRMSAPLSFRCTFASSEGSCFSE